MVSAAAVPCAEKYFDYSGNIESSEAIEALSALAQEQRLGVFRLLVSRGPSGLTAGEIAALLGLRPSTLVGAPNFFELAVATAIVLFNFQSGAALATVVGVLVEVPVMLSVVRLTERTRSWYERGAPAR